MEGKDRKENKRKISSEGRKVRRREELRECNIHKGWKGYAE